MPSETLGSYLKSARVAKNLTATEVAELVGLPSPLPVLAWERNLGHALPLQTLRKLIRIFGLDAQFVFDLLLRHQLSRIEKKFNALERRVR